MSQIPVKDAEHWFRDSNSGSIQCSDSSTYDKYMRAYHAGQQKKMEFNTLQKEVSELKSDMDEIKSLLKTLANKSS